MAAFRARLLMSTAGARVCALASRPLMGARPLLGAVRPLSTLPPTRDQSTAIVEPESDLDDASWEQAWVEATDEVYDSSRSFQDSAAGLRQLIKTGLLRHTDLRDRPDRFFAAHRLLARHAVKHGQLLSIPRNPCPPAPTRASPRVTASSMVSGSRSLDLLVSPRLPVPRRARLAHPDVDGSSLASAGPGFWIRFTVHYNLCFGTVLAVGNEEQVAGMDDVEAHGLLGCFALTEKLAGVQSGLIVQTRAEYDAASQTFKLNNLGATEGAYKNWISQGFVADKAVVLADLTVAGERKGPHAFLMDMRKDGKLEPGVSTGDMGIKTVGNDLDNAWIAFDNVTLPRSALLNRYADVSADGAYNLTSAGIKPF